MRFVVVIFRQCILKLVMSVVPKRNTIIMRIIQGVSMSHRCVGNATKVNIRRSNVDKVHGMSNRGDWESPPELIADLKTVFDFTLDVCASRPNVCEQFYSSEDDGLSRPWTGLCWCNPPYSRKRKIDLWMKKALEEGSKPNTTVLCLPPARILTRWWHNTVPHAAVCVFIKGRLQFRLPGGAIPKNTSSFPSALVVFGIPTYTQVFRLARYGILTFPNRTRKRGPVSFNTK